MCTGRVDPTHVLRAFSNGVDGVFVGGCWLGECHYVTEGNHSAVSMMHMTRKLLKHIGVNPERLTLEHVSAAQGNRFADLITEFTARVKGIGRLGIAEGIDDDRLRIGLEAATSIVPFMRLVERERMRVHFKTREEYAQFFDSEETERLFNEMVIDKMAMKEVLLMLRDGLRLPEEMALKLGVTPAEVARQLQHAARQRLARFDEEQKRFALIQG